MILMAVDFEPRSWMLVAAIAAATFVVLTGMQRMKRRRESTADTAQNSNPLASKTQAPQAAERWQVELHDFTRDAEARIDAKLAALQRLIITADERIAHLESLGLDVPPSRPAKPSPIEQKVTGPHFSKVEPAPQGQARAAAVYAMSDAGNSAATIANQLGSPIAEVELILSLRKTRNS